MVNFMNAITESKALQRPDPRRDGFASAEEAGRFLNLSRAMITKLTQSGSMPSKRFGRSLRIPWNWLLDQVSEATPK
jgi:excisionase family DNA binding protein